MMRDAAGPKSKLAIGFYLLGALLIIVRLPDAFAFWSAHGEMLGFTALLPVVGILLFGGVVQILSDIRWHLASAGGDENA